MVLEPQISSRKSLFQWPLNEKTPVFLLLRGHNCMVRSSIVSFPNIAILRKVVGKNVYATILEGNMGCDRYTIPGHCSCRSYFCCFPLALANTFPWPFMPLFQISLKNSELKTTHNAFRDCCVHFFRHPFLK